MIPSGSNIQIGDRSNQTNKVVESFSFTRSGPENRIPYLFKFVETPNVKLLEACLLSFFSVMFKGSFLFYLI